MFQLGISILLIFLSIISVAIFFSRRSEKGKYACIIVLGDIGRSPRMNYHCLSLVKLGYHVTIIGYYESKLMKEMINNEKIRVIPLNSYPKFLQIGPLLIQYILKAAFLTMTLLLKLIQLNPIPKFILVQNPPSIPTLALAYIYSRLVNNKFLIDWHNYGFTILGLKKDAKFYLIEICKKFELYFGQKSDLNLCVTSAMKSDLKKNNIGAVVMYDKPHEIFKELDINDKNEFISKLIETYKVDNFKHVLVKSKKSTAVLVSSSSWTEDEDFSILVEAFEIYQNKIDNGKTDLPNIICSLTGKGPLKEYYKKIFEEKNFKNIIVNFLWLEPNDYPLLLGSSDLGISLHKSSSNLDLPMKIVDMFGTKLPVCALSFSCISELVKDNENGLLFNNASELAKNLVELLTEFEKPNSKLEVFRRNLSSFSKWNIEWSLKVEPIIKSLE